MTITISLAFITILAVLVLIILHAQSKNPPRTACVGSGAALLVNLPLEEFMKHSPEIVVGKPEMYDDSVKLKIEESLKDKYLKPGNVIILCSRDIYPRDIDQNSRLLVFLKGKDVKQNVWVPTQSSFGAISANKEGNFQVGAKEYSLEEIKQVISKLEQ